MSARIDGCGEPSESDGGRAACAASVILGPSAGAFLKLGGWKLGLLINFHVPLLRDGIKRVVFGLEQSAEAST